MLKIARELEADGIKNGAGKDKWHTSNINSILRNEKHIGYALLQKTYTVDFLAKKRVKNNGLIPQYYVVNLSCLTHQYVSEERNVQNLYRPFPYK